MPYQQYYYQDPSTYQKSRLDSAIRHWRVGPMETFKTAASESFNEWTALGWIVRQAKESNAASNQLILKDEWNEQHFLWREDVEWQPNFTEGIAEVRRDRSDYLADLSIRRANVDFWSLPNLSGTILGALPSPENLVAWGGMIGRAGILAKLATTGRVPLTSRFLKPVFQGMADAAIADTLFQTVKATVQINQGKNIDAVHAAFEIGIATMTGGFIGTFPMAYQIAKKIPSAFKPALIKQAVKDIADSKPVSIFKNRAKRSTEEEMSPDEIKAELDKRTKAYADEADELYRDPSREAGKDYVKHSFEQGKKIVKIIANCLRRSK